MSHKMTVAAVGAALAEVFDILDAQFEVSAEILNFRPLRDDAWTMAEHLEHVALVNHYLLMIIRKGVVKAVKRAEAMEPPEGESDLGHLAEAADPNSFPWPAPQHMLPTGIADMGEVREALRFQRDECLALLASMGKGEGALHTVRMSVNNLGKINMYQWLYFLAQHGRYHLHYFERVKREIRAPEDSGLFAAKE